MSLETLDIKKWWKTHSLQIVGDGTGKFVGECPWKIAHVSMANRCTVIPGEDPAIECPDPSCNGRTFKDLLAEWTDSSWHCEGGDQGEEDDGKDGIEPMGFSPDGSKYYYRSVRTGHIRSLAPKQHDELNLYSLIPNPGFWRVFADSPKGISWKLAARKMMSLCQAKGYYFKSEVRGSGIFLDRKRLVVNLGAMLLVNDPGSPNFVPVPTAPARAASVRERGRRDDPRRRDRLRMACGGLAVAPSLLDEWWPRIRQERDPEPDRQGYAACERYVLQGRHDSSRYP